MQCCQDPKLLHTTLYVDGYYYSIMPKASDLYICSLNVNGTSHWLSINSALPFITLQEWKSVQALLTTIGKNSLNRKVMNCDPLLLHPELAARTQELLGKIELKKLKKQSAGAAVFYVWVRYMILMIQKLNENAVKYVIIDNQCGFHEFLFINMG